MWEHWYSIPHYRRVSTLEQDTQPSPEVGDCLSLVLPNVPRKRRPQFPHLPWAEGCQPPKVSATSGRKAKPCLLHASSAPSSFPLWAWSKAKPAALAAPGIVVTFMGGVTLTSMAASLPPVQLGTRTSAGRRSLPGRRKRPSLTGPRPAATAVSKIASVGALCRLMRSPPEPQQSAWSPLNQLNH